MVKRGSLVTIARPERPEKPDRPVNNRDKEKDPNAPGCKYFDRRINGTKVNLVTARLSVLLKDENYSVGTLVSCVIRKNNYLTHCDAACYGAIGRNHQCQSE